VGNNPHPPHSQPVVAIEAGVMALRRSHKRRALARLSERRGERADRLPDAMFELLDVVAAASERGRPPTVTESAVALGVDQPRASRLAAQSVDAGLLRREADQHDGRRSQLALTANGVETLSHIRAFRQRIVGEAISGWTPDDRAVFAGLLTRFVRDFALVVDPPAETGSSISAVDRLLP
jgi:DNA-binding MarR family transcriptional regulator